MLNIESSNKKYLGNDMLSFVCVSTPKHMRALLLPPCLLCYSYKC